MSNNLKGTRWRYSGARFKKYLVFFLINWFTNTLYCAIIKKEVQYIVFLERVSGPTVQRRRPRYGTDVRMEWA
nr:MAG TPA: hypothetical protein [Caudoviricetes sp.]